MFKMKTFIFALITAIVVPACAYCQTGTENRQVANISGTISEIDFAGSTIVVEKAVNDQMTFSVPDDAVITAGTEVLGFDDLAESDPVVVQYYSPSPGKYVAVSIEDDNVFDE